MSRGLGDVYKRQGILQPATSAMLHNLSTIGISLKSMTNLLQEESVPQLNA